MTELAMKGHIEVLCYLIVLGLRRSHRFGESALHMTI
jgi:hypothetical protein